MDDAPRQTLERLGATAAAMLQASNGPLVAAGVLAVSRLVPEDVSSAGESSWAVRVFMPANLFGALLDEDRDLAEEALLETFRHILRGADAQVTYVVVVPELVDAPDDVWRRELHRWFVEAAAQRKEDARLEVKTGEVVCAHGGGEDEIPF